MSKTHRYFEEIYPDYKLNMDIDSNKDLTSFRKLKNKLEKNNEIEKILKLIEEDFEKQLNIPDLFYYLKSLISILGLQFIFLLLKNLQFLKEIEMIAMINDQTKEIFFEISSLILEKLRDLRGYEQDFDTIKGVSNIKPPPKNFKKPKFIELSKFDSILIQGMILQKKIEVYLNNGILGDNSILFLKEIDKYQSNLIQSIDSNISSKENQILKEITSKNQLLAKKLKEPETLISKKQIQPLKSRTCLKMNESLPLENLEIEYKNYHFPLSYEQKIRLENCICAFLNANGGRIFLGVRDDGNKVVGLNLNYKNKMIVENELHQIFYSINPKLNENQWKIIFLPIVNDFEVKKFNFYVIKLIIKKSSKYVYCTSENKYYKRRDGKVKMLYPDDVKQEIIKKKEGAGEDENNDDFDDPVPIETDLNNKMEFKYQKNLYDSYYFNSYDDKNYNYEIEYVPKNSPSKIEQINNNFPPLNQSSQYNPNLNEIKNNYQKNQDIYYYPNMDNSINSAKPPKTTQKTDNYNKTSYSNPNLNDIDLNKKVLSLEVLDLINKREEFLEMGCFVRKLLTEFLQIKVVKVVLRFEKRECLFELLDEEIYQNRELISSTIQDNIKSFNNKIWKIKIQFAEKKKSNNYLNKLVKIKTN